MLKKVFPATPTPTKENINNWAAPWWLLANPHRWKGQKLATMCYTWPHFLAWSDFQTPTAMISPNIVLPKDCNETTVTIVCHNYHSQCGFNSHPGHPPVLLQQLHTLSPFTAPSAQSPKSALLGEHPPSKPRQEGSSRGSHMGQVRQGVDLT